MEQMMDKNLSTVTTTGGIITGTRSAYPPPGILIELVGNPNCWGFAQGDVDCKFGRKTLRHTQFEQEIKNYIGDKW